MIGFRQFLDESWSTDKDYGDFHHNSKVGDHHVGIEFRNRAPYNDKSKRKDGKYMILYTVGGSLRRGRQYVSDDGAKKILKHVHGKVSQFMRVAKPKKVSFSSHDKQKQKLHAGLAKHLAKRFGGKVNVNHDVVGVIGTEHSVEKD